MLHVAALHTEYSSQPAIGGELCGMGWLPFQLGFCWTIASLPDPTAYQAIVDTAR